MNNISIHLESCFWPLDKLTSLNTCFSFLFVRGCSPLWSALDWWWPIWPMVSSPPSSGLSSCPSCGWWVDFFSVCLFYLSVWNAHILCFIWLELLTVSCVFLFFFLVLNRLESSPTHSHSHRTTEQRHWYVVILYWYWKKKSLRIYISTVNES